MVLVCDPLQCCFFFVNEFTSIFYLFLTKFDMGKIMSIIQKKVIFFILKLLTHILRYIYINILWTSSIVLNWSFGSKYLTIVRFTNWSNIFPISGSFWKGPVNFGCHDAVNRHYYVHVPTIRFRHYGVIMINSSCVFTFSCKTSVTTDILSYILYFYY